MTEFVDPPEQLDEKYTSFFKLLENCKNAVFFTGAGISTAAKIPDFRGDKGLDKAPLNIAQMGVSERDLDSKMPTFGHRSISVLLEHDCRFQFVVTSNHDGLHQKSGTPWSKSANIFGTAYIEECSVCKQRFTRRVIVPSLQRVCDNLDCAGRLKKTGVRYGQTVPEGPLRRAEEAARGADLAIVLGSSMTTSPFCNLPTLSKRYILCNKQTTPYDEDAEICIHDSIDNFMSRLLLELLPNVSIDMDYRQEFEIREEESCVIITTPRPNEPAVFIDEATVWDSTGNPRKFECNLSGIFSVSRDLIEDGNVIEIEFKESFHVENARVKFLAGQVVQGSFVKHLKYH